MLISSFAQVSAPSPAFSRRSSSRTRTGEKRSRWLPYVLAVCGFAPANVLAQHVHGVIELGIVVEGDTVAVSLNAPLSDVVGFEHAPQNDEQAELLQRADAVLSDPDAMFGLAVAASCRSLSVSVEGPDYLGQATETVHAGATSHDDDHHHDDHSDHHDHEGSGHDDHDHGDGHGDHDDHHSDSDHHDHGHSGDHDHGDSHDHSHSGDHDHDHDEQHAEVNATYEWTCDTVSNLDALELRFVDDFAGVEEIEVQILTSSGARVLTAGRDTESVPLATD